MGDKARYLGFPPYYDVSPLHREEVGETWHMTERDTDVQDASAENTTTVEGTASVSVGHTDGELADLREQLRKARGALNEACLYYSNRIIELENELVHERWLRMYQPRRMSGNSAYLTFDQNTKGETNDR